MEFHENRGEWILLDDDMKIATARKAGALFSYKPLKVKKPVSIKVLDEGSLEAQELVVGVTSTDPSDWDRETLPIYMKNTWLLHTKKGEIWIDGFEAKPSASWSKKLGIDNKLSEGDEVSVVLNWDKTVTIKYNKAELSSVFINLPDGKLWLVVDMRVRKLQIKSAGKELEK